MSESTYEGRKAARAAELKALPDEGPRTGGGDKTHNAYYYVFDVVGVPEIDAILAAVASAGAGYHSTEDWNDDENGPSCADVIQEYARRAALRIEQLEELAR